VSDDTKKEDVFFSQRVDEALKDTVRRIQGKHDRFGTGWMAYAGADGAEPLSERVEAWQDPATKLWKIERFSHIPGGVTKQETVARQGLAFFDALHYCARWQKTEEEKGRQAISVAGKRWEKIPHFRMAAEAAGQAIDEDGEVHPCAFGRVLTDQGFFSDKALEDALKTEGEELGKLPSVNFADGLVGYLLGGTPQAGTEADWLAQSVKKRDVINQFKAVIDAGEAMAKGLEHAVSNGFKTDFQDTYIRDVLSTKTKTYMKSALSLGLVPAVGYATGNPRYAVNRAFMLLRNEFQAAVEGLPEQSPEKPLLLDFAKAAEFSFWMERAGHVYQECQERKRSSEDTREGLPFIEKAGAATGLSPIEVNRLKDEYFAGKVECGLFRNEIMRKWNDDYSYRYQGSVRGQDFKTILNAKISLLEGKKSLQPD
jgi:hypothetical protein